MRKRSLISIYIVLLSLQCHAQGVDSLIQVGDSLRDIGDYRKALITYKKASIIDKKSPFAIYEIAYTYLILNNNRKAISYCNQIIKLNRERTIEAYILKSSALENMGKSKKSMNLYNAAIKRYPSNYLLNYNLGVTYFNSNKLDNARIQFIKAIEIDKLQSNAHFMLGLLMNDMGCRVQSMLSLYFFLLLEPNTEKSTETYKLLISQWRQSIEVDSLNTNKLTIRRNPKNNNIEFNTIDLSVSSAYAINYRKYIENRNNYELLVSNTSAFFNLIGYYALIDNDIWHSLYMKFFNDLLNANQVDPFCYYISSTCDDAIINGWLESNKEKIQAFSTWANNKLLEKK